MEKESVINSKNYWMDIQSKKEDGRENPDNSENSRTEMQKNPHNRENVTFNVSPDEKTAILAISSFAHHFIEEDRKILIELFSRLEDYENLIIDIQGNTGGSTHYWQHKIVPLIAGKEYIMKSTIAFRRSPFVKHYYGEHFETATSEIPDLPNIPPELHKWDILIDLNETTIIPDTASVDYQGDVYLLVDQHVYSASEAMAVFAKQTGFAKVAGTITGGDGIGRDPVLFSLPNSGIVVVFPVFMGLNPDGSSNEEKKTVPDILLEGETRETRRDELLKLLKG